VLDGVRNALEQMLAQEGIKSAVIATPFGAQSTQPATAIIFSIASPPVKVGSFQFEGASSAMLPKITQQATHFVQAYSTEMTTTRLERYFESFYKDHGYAEAQVHAYRSDNPVISAEAILVPFRVVLQEGRVYKLGAISLSPAMSDRFPDIAKALALRLQDSPDDLRLEITLGDLERRLRSKGYIDCSATARAEIDDVTGTANYVLDVDPGPIYHLAFIKFENTNDAIRDLLMRNWQMVPGDPFDESYVAKFMLRAQNGDRLLRQALDGLKATYDVRPDTQTHEVTLVIRLENQ
jgi:outer membrane protein assembly factor BamA